MPPTQFPTPPDFHALDWWGQIGGKRDPVTGEGIDGWIYDCNPYGHTIRPYRPPVPRAPTARVHWICTEDGRLQFDIDVDVPLESTGNPLFFSGYIEQDAFLIAATVTLTELPNWGGLDTTISYQEMPLYLTGNTDCNIEGPYQLFVPEEPDTIFADWECDLTDTRTPTPAQQDQRDRFAAAHQAWLALTPAQRTQQNRHAAREHRSGYNRFMSQHARA